MGIMESKTEDKTIKELIELHEAGILKPNWEYQRGLVWNEAQMCLLIDSIFRGYPIPLIYLHEKKESVGGYGRDSLEVIDGQQRINTFVGFVQEAAFKEGPEGKISRPFKPLFDPSDERESKKFPLSMQGSPVPWAGKTWGTLPSELRDDFMKATVQVVTICCEKNEARDLFIRLQGGCALQPQEVRDSRPGDFCRIVLSLGGKSQLNMPGHEFFRKLSKTKASNPKTRQLVAQTLMLFLLRQEHKKKGGAGDYFVTINSDALDEFYVQNIDMSSVSNEIERFREILTKLVNILGGDTPPMDTHLIMHLILFTDILMGNYSPAWESSLQPAHDKFVQRLAEVSKLEYSAEAPKDAKEIWDWIINRSNANYAIKRRHEIYTNLMMDFMGKSLQPKDPRRAYTAEERRYIYYRDDKKCHECGGEVLWDDAEIHHVVEHSKGGQTTLANGVLVHKECHKRGRPKKGA